MAGSDPPSSAIPGFYRSGVLLDGVSYLDGGVSDAIPVQEAARRGAQTIVVIRTVPSQMFYTPAVVQADGALAGRE
ncbi:phospholipase, patatin family [Klebsiella pneumoniae]|nr:phospholipase, patatin family [Klebsiella pneumoniae]